MALALQNNEIADEKYTLDYCYDTCCNCRIEETQKRDKIEKSVNENNGDITE